jgi:inner membrane transporter RhtA
VTSGVQARPAGWLTRAADRVPPPGLALGGVVSLQCGAVLATRLFPAVGVTGVVALRLSIAAVVLGAWRQSRLRRALPRWDRATWALAAATGTLLAAHHLSYYEAIDRIPLGAATTIEFAGPLTVALVTARRRSHVAWALLAAAGVVLIARPGGHLGWAGLLFAFSAGACWACYITVSATLTRRAGDASPLAPAVAWGAALSLPLGILRNGSSLLRPSTLLLALAVSLLSSVLAYSLQMDALRRMPRGLFSILTSTEPAVAALLGLLALGQRLTLADWLGIAAVVTASAGATGTGRQSGRARPATRHSGP